MTCSPLSSVAKAAAVRIIFVSAFTLTTSALSASKETLFATKIEPGRQLLQLGRPGSGWNLPTGQDRQEVDELMLEEYRPFEQMLHAELLPRGRAQNEKLKT